MSRFFLSVYVLCLALVPTKGRDETRAVIKIRGEGDTRKPHDLALDPADAQWLKARKRVAILPFAVDSIDPLLTSQGPGCAEAMASDLRYIPAYLVADRSEVLGALARRAAPPARDDLAALAELGRALEAKLLVVGTLSDGPNLGLKLEVRLVDVGGDRPKVAATARVEKTRQEIYALTDEALLDLLKEAGVKPDPSVVAEIRKVPTRSFEARSEYDLGLGLLEKAEAKVDEADRKGLLRAALDHARKSLKADPEFVQASLLEASAHYALENKQDLKHCLEEALRTLDPARVDVLTELELNGDYATFRDGRFPAAVEKYEEMLRYEPGNSRALWALTMLYSGSYGAAELAREPGAEAKSSRFAARLIAAHPRSDLVAAFAVVPKPPQP
jgi:tetratricopeptide (TPR) repeat protein